MRVALLLLTVLLLVACTGVNEAPPPGNYIVIPVTQTFAHPDFLYCSAGQCWSAVIQQATPTPEGPNLTLTAFPEPTRIPTSAVPTPTAIQPLYVCSLSTSGVNVRPIASTSSTPLFVLQPGQRMLVASMLKQDWYEVVYHSAPAYIYKAASQLCTQGQIIQ